MRGEHLYTQQRPPDISSEDPQAMKKVIELAKSVNKKLYELEERIEKMEKFFAESEARI